MDIMREVYVPIDLSTSEHQTFIKPTLVTDSYWIYEYPAVSTSRPYINVGKWMLRYYKTELDEKWKKLVNHFCEGELPGVVQMKCSTNLHNPRSSSDTIGIIILYCNKSSEKNNIMKIGRNIKDRMNYYPAIYYKTDTQTKIGTSTTGQKKNSVYKIEASVDPNVTQCNAILASGKNKGKRCKHKAKYPKIPLYCGTHKKFVVSLVANKISYHRLHLLQSKLE